MHTPGRSDGSTATLEEDLMRCAVKTFFEVIAHTICTKLPDGQADSWQINALFHSHGPRAQRYCPSDCVT